MPVGEQFCCKALSSDEYLTLCMFFVYLPILHVASGFPMYPGGQEHCARWLFTVQIAPKPQLQGSSQCSLRQAKL